MFVFMLMLMFMLMFMLSLTFLLLSIGVHLMMYRFTRSWRLTRTPSICTTSDSDFYLVRMPIPSTSAGLPATSTDQVLNFLLKLSGM